MAGSHEVRGSNPLGSTINTKGRRIKRRPFFFLAPDIAVSPDGFEESLQSRRCGRRVMRANPTFSAAGHTRSGTKGLSRIRTANVQLRFALGNAQSSSEVRVGKCTVWIRPALKASEAGERRLLSEGAEKCAVRISPLQEQHLLGAGLLVLASSGKELSELRERRGRGEPQEPSERPERREPQMPRSPRSRRSVWCASAGDGRRRCRSKAHGESSIHSRRDNEGRGLIGREPAKCTNRYAV